MSNVFDINEFRRRKQTKSELTDGRKPLYITHRDGKLSGSPHLNPPRAEDFGDRVNRVESSLDKINLLMSQLKMIAESETQIQGAPLTTRPNKKPVSLISYNPETAD